MIAPSESVVDMDNVFATVISLQNQVRQFELEKISLLTQVDELKEELECRANDLRNAEEEIETLKSEVYEMTRMQIEEEY